MPHAALSLTAGGLHGTRLAVALALSLGVHAGAGLWVSRMAPAAPGPTAVRAVQVRLVGMPERVALAPAPVARRLSPAVPAAAPPAPSTMLAAVRPRAVAPVLLTAVRPHARAAAPATPATRASPAKAVSPVRPPATASAAIVPAAAPAVPLDAAAGDTVAVPPAAPRARALAAASGLETASAPTAAAPPDSAPQPAADNPQPRYPPTARRRGQQGRVLLRLEVAPDGTASRAVVIESSGVASLDSAAQEAVERWRFVPALRAGKAVTATVRVPVVFRLDARG